MVGDQFQLDWDYIAANNQTEMFKSWLLGRYLKEDFIFTVEGFSDHLDYPIRATNAFFRKEWIKVIPLPSLDSFL